MQLCYSKLLRHSKSSLQALPKHNKNALRNIWCSSPLRLTLSTHRANSLRWSHTDKRPRSRRRRLPDTTSRPHADRNIRISPPLLPLNNHERVAKTSHRKTSCYPCLVVVIEGDGSAAAVCSPDGPVLAKVAVVFGPQLVLCAIAVVVAVEGLAGVVGGVVLGEGFHNVEFYPWVAGEAIEGKVGVSLRVVVGCVVDHAGIC